MAMMPRRETATSPDAEGFQRRIYRELDGLLTPIELTLVSVLQGVILQILLPVAIDLLHTGRYYLAIYAIPSFLIMVAVWVSFILLSLAFVSWPFDVWHNVIYFLLTALECVAFGFIDDPTRWFMWTALFCVVSGISFWYHVRMVRSRRRYYAAGSAEDQLLEDAQRELARDGRLTVIYAVSGAIAALASWLLGMVNPHPWYALVQVGFGIAATPIAAYQLKRSFVLVKRRSQLVEVMIEARLREAAGAA